MRDLTEKQYSLINFIADKVKKELRQPTGKEICEFLKVSSRNSMIQYLNAFEKKGWIKGRNLKGIIFSEEARVKLNLIFADDKMLDSAVNLFVGCSNLVDHGTYGMRKDCKDGARMIISRLKNIIERTGEKNGYEDI